MNLECDECNFQLLAKYLEASGNFFVKGTDDLSQIFRLY